MIINPLPPQVKRFAAAYSDAHSRLEEIRHMLIELREWAAKEGYHNYTSTVVQIAGELDDIADSLRS